MLCAFDPVKYCIAAPADCGSTRRMSACRPLASMTLALVSPWPSTRITSGCAVKVAMTPSPPPTARMSRSPQVSAPRLRLPTTVNSTRGVRFSETAENDPGGLVHVGGQEAASVALALLDGLQDERLLAVAHAFHRAHLAGPRRGLQRLERGHAEFLVAGASRSSAQPPAGAAVRAARPGTPPPVPGDTAYRRYRQSRGCVVRGPCRCRGARAASSRSCRRRVWARPRSYRLRCGMRGS